MDVGTGLLLYLALLGLGVIIAGARGLAWGWFVVFPPACSFAGAVLGSLLSGGSGVVMGAFWFAPAGISLIMAMAIRSKSRRLADGDAVAGYRKCPDCAEQVREEARKCRHCGSSLVEEAQ